MSWVALALIGHVANGAAFIIDKALLSTAFKRSATYAGLVGLLSLLVLIASPWVDTWPHDTTLVMALVSGATFILALYAFFAALARAEASRIVPIVGSLIPILTLGGTWLFLNERLGPSQLAGFALLVLATVILSSSGGSAKPPTGAIFLSIGSSFLFAVSSVSGKFVYDDAGFLPGFITTRIAAGMTALLLVVLIDPKAGQELLRIAHASPNPKRTPPHAAPLAVLGQSLGAVGFLFVQLAVAHGSASIVNALQAVQYALLVIVAFVLRHRAPQLLQERIDRRTILMKSIALAFVALGLALVV